MLKDCSIWQFMPLLRPELKYAVLMNQIIPGLLQKTAGYKTD